MDKYSVFEEQYSALAKSLGMRCDGVNRVICGQRDGYNMILCESRGPYGIRNLFTFHVHVAAARPTGEMLTAAEMQELENRLKKLDELRFVGYCWQDGHDIIVPDMGGGGILSSEIELYQRLAGKLDCLCSFLKDKGCKPCCSRCGQETEAAPFRLGKSYQHLFRLGERYQHLCPACEADTRNRLASRKQKRRRKENVVFGLVGALLGALPGMAAIVWDLQSEIYLEILLIGAAMAVCILKGYELLGGRLTKKAVVIGSMVMLPAIYVAYRFAWALRIYRKGRFTLTLEQCFSRIPLLISNHVIDRKEYIMELAALYLLLLLGAVLGIVFLFKWKSRAHREWFARLG